MIRGAGGMPGGVGTFVIGAAMIVASGYLLLTRVTVASSGWLVILGLLAAGIGLAAGSLRPQGARSESS